MKGGAVTWLNNPVPVGFGFVLCPPGCGGFEQLRGRAEVLVPVGGGVVLIGGYATTINDH